MAAEKEVKLLGFWASPYSQRCRIALAEKGVEYEYKEENLAEKSELLLRSNPIHKKIPVVLHGGNPICESLIIIEYIDETWPGNNSLLPSDPYARAHARFLADYVDKKVFGSALWLWRPLEKEALREAKKEFVEVLKTLEAELGDNKYLAGDSFGLVDIAMLPFTAWFHTYEAYSGINVWLECPKLAEWAERCKERESVAKNLSDPAEIHEYVGLLRKKFGVE